MRDAQELATAYDRAWVSGDADTLRNLLAEDVTFAGPFAKTTGVEETVAGLVEMSKLVTQDDTQLVLSDDSNAIIWAQIATQKAPATPTASWLKISGGNIVSIDLLIDTPSWK